VINQLERHHVLDWASRKNHAGVNTCRIRYVKMKGYERKKKILWTPDVGGPEGQKKRLERVNTFRIRYAKTKGIPTKRNQGVETTA
jgi:hypothetical protein